MSCCRYILCQRFVSFLAKAPLPQRPLVYSTAVLFIVRRFNDHNARESVTKSRNVIVIHMYCTIDSQSAIVSAYLSFFLFIDACPYLIVVSQ